MFTPHSCVVESKVRWERGGDWNLFCDHLTLANHTNDVHDDVQGDVKDDMICCGAECDVRITKLQFEMKSASVILAALAAGATVDGCKSNIVSGNPMWVCEWACDALHASNWNCQSGAARSISDNQLAQCVSEVYPDYNCVKKVIAPPPPPPTPSVVPPPPPMPSSTSTVSTNAGIRPDSLNVKFCQQYIQGAGCADKCYEAALTCPGSYASMPNGVEVTKCAVAANPSCSSQF